jgi:hypothetical protein
MPQVILCRARQMLQNLNVLLFPIEFVPPLSKKHELVPTNSLFPGIYSNDLFYCIYFK